MLDLKGDQILGYLQKKKKKKSSANVLCFRLTRYLYILV